jgi:hypothetical protein
MTTRKVIAVVGLGLACLALIYLYLRTGGLIFGRDDVHRQTIGYCFDVATDPAGSRLLVVAGERGLHLLDLDRGELEYAASTYDAGYYRNPKVAQGRAYVADSLRGLVVLDIDGDAPVITWIQRAGAAGGVHVVGDLAFVANTETGVRAIDVRDPSRPVLIDTWNYP